MKKIIIVFNIIMLICCVISSCWLFIPLANSENKHTKEDQQRQALIAAQEDENRKREEALIEEHRQKRIQEKEEQDKRIRESYQSIASERGYASFDEFVAKNSVSYDKFVRAIETKTLSEFSLKKGDIILVPAHKAVILQEENMLLTIDTRALSRYKTEVNSQTGGLSVGFLSEVSTTSSDSPAEINSQTPGIYEATDMFFLELDRKINISETGIIINGSKVIIEKRFIGKAFYMEYIENRNTGAGRRAAVRPVFKYIEVAIENTED